MSEPHDKNISNEIERTSGLTAASLLFLSSIIAAFTLAWVILAPMDFLYSVWHDHGGIKEGIEEFAPKNRYKTGFAETSRQQRFELFGDINRSIHQSGRGLEDIVYKTPSSQGVQRLLREPEVVHLQDVANLINLLAWFAGFNLVFLVLIVAYAWRYTPSAFAFKRQLFALALLGLAAFLVLSVFGPTDVFNQLHIWIFPDENQWFFYYQESLMSTMMFAPKLFAWIGGALTIVALIIYTTWIAGVNYLVRTKMRVDN